MKLATLPLSSSLPAHLFSGKRLSPPTTSTDARIRICASRRGAYGGDLDGNIVDEDMIVLRKRIQEMKVSERDSEPPSHWLGWEKEYYRGNYNSDICEAMGVLQSVLMNTRPALALGMVALLMLSVPTSTIVILMEVAKLLTPGMHH